MIVLMQFTGKESLAMCPCDEKRLCIPDSTFCSYPYRATKLPLSHYKEADGQARVGKQSHVLYKHTHLLIKKSPEKWKREVEEENP
jgi:hypothetical protein